MRYGLSYTADALVTISITTVSAEPNSSAWVLHLSRSSLLCAWLVSDIGCLFFTEEIRNLFLQQKKCITSLNASAWRQNVAPYWSTALWSCQLTVPQELEVRYRILKQQTILSGTRCPESVGYFNDRDLLRTSICHRQSRSKLRCQEVCSECFSRHSHRLTQWYSWAALHVFSDGV